MLWLPLLPLLALDSCRATFCSFYTFGVRNACVLYVKWYEVGVFWDEFNCVNFLQGVTCVFDFRSDFSDNRLKVIVNIFWYFRCMAIYWTYSGSHPGTPSLCSFDFTYKCGDLGLSILSPSAMFLLVKFSLWNLFTILLTVSLLVVVELWFSLL